MRTLTSIFVISLVIFFTSCSQDSGTDDTPGDLADKTNSTPEATSSFHYDSTKYITPATAFSAEFEEIQSKTLLIVTGKLGEEGEYFLKFNNLGSRDVGKNRAAGGYLNYKSTERAYQKCEEIYFELFPEKDQFGRQEKKAGYDVQSYIGQQLSRISGVTSVEIRAPITLRHETYDFDSNTLQFSRPRIAGFAGFQILTKLQSGFLGDRLDIQYFLTSGLPPEDARIGLPSESAKQFLAAWKDSKSKDAYLVFKGDRVGTQATIITSAPPVISIDGLEFPVLAYDRRAKSEKGISPQALAENITLFDMLRSGEPVMGIMTQVKDAAR